MNLKYISALESGQNLSELVLPNLFTFKRNHNHLQEYLGIGRI